MEEEASNPTNMTKTKEQTLTEEIARLCQQIAATQSQIQQLEKIPVLTATDTESALKQVAAERLALQRREDLQRVLTALQGQLKERTAELETLQHGSALAEARGRIAAARTRMEAIAAEMESIRLRQQELIKDAAELSASVDADFAIVQPPRYLLGNQWIDRPPLRMLVVADSRYAPTTPVIVEINGKPGQFAFGGRAV
ncbi:hypothetical protein FDUTEX481_02075 [Tolypothrix sp. PCC 7601]|nr:hypothetical protein FDUTEX481_02075 [Tolypothrix sp. PCC 7601]BAY90769.1 hypothetical protein NIES3275_27860 [Microchaete diplosiphon NIES-3275]